MTKNIFAFLYLLSIMCIYEAKSQSIAIDGKFDDWNGIASYTDPIADGNGLDLREFSITNDDENIYIRLIINGIANISDSNSLYLNIDTDDNPATGFSTNGIGSELGWRFGSRYGFHYYNGNKDTVYAWQLKMVSLSTYKNDTFEIALNRHTQSLLGFNLFTNNTIKLNFVNGISGGDQMPNSGSTISYTFNNIKHSDFGSINLQKCNSKYIRVMTYNVLFDGLTDAARVNSFKRIFKAINADVIILNECTYTSAAQVKTLLDSWIPLGTPSGWYCYKVDGGNIICSRFTSLYTKNISFRKATLTYIDLPADYQTNLVVIGTHFAPFNDADTLRQREADVIAAYLRDMKAGTTAYPIPANTPFIIAGDLNMVNSYSPLNTLLTGNIINIIYGASSFPDWNNAPLTNSDGFVADRNMTYTWRPVDPYSKRGPGKLDFLIHSNTNLTVKKSFVLQSEEMNTTRLNQYSLLLDDTYIASDHLPLVMDIQIPTITTITPLLQWNGNINTAWENPANWNCSMVPDKYSDVIIPKNVPHYPVVNMHSEIHGIILNNGSNMQVNNNIQFIINGK